MSPEKQNGDAGVAAPYVAGIENLSPHHKSRSRSQDVIPGLSGSTLQPDHNPFALVRELDRIPLDRLIELSRQLDVQAAEYRRLPARTREQDDRMALAAAVRIEVRKRVEQSDTDTAAAA
ncbi:hypothetical protein GCM10010472_04180 [Pseudonocardia halophobica]|uniref:Uncharacterized protein n=1 Tax=Pseudonocardia halophobica TaxID=29401 RepID=A0A9W6NYD6_9PSEU|nr:hypothetical protein [Pseudonocardia halophobica]GLL13377.1 hypothetical protein GCM10017577_45200 [Pseudonocardia halophobica]